MKIQSIDAILEDITVYHWRTFRALLEAGKMAPTGVTLFRCDNGSDRPSLVGTLDAPGAPPDLLLEAAVPLLKKYEADFYLVFGEAPMAVVPLPEAARDDQAKQEFFKKVSESVYAEDIPDAKVIHAVVLLGGGLAKGFMAWSRVDTYTPDTPRTLPEADISSRPVYSRSTPDKIDNPPN